MKRIYIILLVVLGVISLTACGGSQTNDDSKIDDTPKTGENLPEDSSVVLTYRLSVQLDSLTDDSLDFIVEFPDEYQVPIDVNSNGKITVAANEFPRMILRICRAGSDQLGCNEYVDHPSLTFDADLVLDACGFSAPNYRCGSEDTTVFTGLISNTGSFRINSVAIRSRIFAVSSKGDGYSADVTDSGLINDLDRLFISITTGTAGTVLKGVGSTISQKQVTLVAGGRIPFSTDILGGTYYLATMTGEFDADPFGLIN